MNNQELKNFRKDFHDNVELGFHKKHKLSLKDYKKILKKTVDNTIISEESSKEIYVFMGNYTMANGSISLTYYNDKEILFRKYKDLETGRIIQICKDDIERFESRNNIVFNVSDELTEEAYDETYDVIKCAYFKELLYSSELDAYKLIKRLTPSK